MIRTGLELTDQRCECFLTFPTFSLRVLCVQVGSLTRTCGTTSTCASPRVQWTTTTNRSSETTSTSAPFPVSPPVPPLPLSTTPSALDPTCLAACLFHCLSFVYFHVPKIVFPSLFLPLLGVRCLSLFQFFPPLGHCCRIFSSHTRSFSRRLSLLLSPQSSGC